nr:MAG TPA: hypothetical protein [Caudoviricetes sp.]
MKPHNTPPKIFTLFKITYYQSIYSIFNFIIDKFYFYTYYKDVLVETKLVLHYEFK